MNNSIEVMSNQYQVSQSQYSLLVLHAKIRRRTHKSPLLHAILPYVGLNIYLLLTYRIMPNEVVCIYELVVQSSISSTGRCSSAASIVPTPGSVLGLHAVPQIQALLSGDEEPISCG